MIDFPNSPTLGQQFTAAGVTWQWDGTKWLPSGLSPTVVPGINDNRIINGDMRIDQRNGGASGTANNVYTIDRWQYVANQAGKITWGRATATPATGFGYCLSFTSSSAYTPLLSDYFIIRQTIEADMVSDFAFGTASAQTVTLSFWAQSSLTGMFSGSLTNVIANRSYPFSYSLPIANTWTKITVTIPGDTTGSWVLSGNGASTIVVFDLGCGGTYHGPANVWAGPNGFWGVTGAVTLVAVNGATFNVTGVKLEIGSVATPYNRQSLAKSMADCQRYFWTTTSYFLGLTTSNAAWSSQPTLPCPVFMRTNPTMSGAVFGASSGNNGTPAVATATPLFVSINNSAANWTQGAGGATVQLNASFSAEL